MAAENCSSSVLMDPYSWSGSHWGPSTTDFLNFETEALARALSASMLPNPPAAPSAVDTSTPSSSSMSSAFFPCSPSTTASTFTTPTGAATPGSSSAGSPFPLSRPTSPRPTPPPPRPQPGPGAVAAGRISKRKPRRSPPKRTPIQFIETDPARFREMVQQMTGIGMPPPVPAQGPMPIHPYQPAMPMMHANGSQQMLQSPAAQVLAAMPTLDTSAGFDDTAAVPSQHPTEQILGAQGVLDNPLSYFFPEFEFSAEELMMMAIPEFSHQQPHQQQQPKPLPPCFPTLESWSE